MLNTQDFAVVLDRFPAKATDADISAFTDDEKATLTDIVGEWLIDWQQTSDFDYPRQLKQAWERYGGLSDRQLRGGINCVRAEANRAGMKAAQATSDSSTLSNVVALMQHAKANGVGQPKFRLATGLGTLKLSMATNRSKTPGAIFVKRDTEYLGKLSDTGRPDYRLSDDASAMTALLALNADPAGVAAAHGQQVGNCSFCGRELTDGRSIAMGYGPICAGHYGLPWGEHDATESATEDATSAPCSGQPCTFDEKSAMTPKVRASVERTERGFDAATLNRDWCDIPDHVIEDIDHFSSYIEGLHEVHASQAGHPLYGYQRDTDGSWICPSRLNCPDEKTCETHSATEDVIEDHDESDSYIEEPNGNTARWDYMNDWKKSEEAAF
jgi:hypothetical protein